MKVSALSPLLGLAIELQEAILAKYYEGTSLSLHYQDGWMIIKGMPSLHLEATCKALRRRSRVARDRYVSKMLNVEGNATKNALAGRLSSPQDLSWPLEHITSLRFIMYDIVRVLLQDDLQRILRSFPNIRNMDIYTTSRKICMPATTRQYTPLDTDDKKRLIADVLQGDWEPLMTTSGISTFVCSIEKAWFKENNLPVAESSSVCETRPEKRLVLKVISTIDAVDNTGGPFYQTVTKYESAGLPYPLASLRDIEKVDLIVLSKICRVDDMEYSTINPDEAS